VDGRLDRKTHSPIRRTRSNQAQLPIKQVDSNPRTVSSPNLVLPSVEPRPCLSASATQLSPSSVHSQPAGPADRGSGKASNLETENAVALCSSAFLGARWGGRAEMRLGRRRRREEEDNKKRETVERQKNEPLTHRTLNPSEGPESVNAQEI
jgi:hypothetical protein